MSSKTELIFLLRNEINSFRSRHKLGIPISDKDYGIALLHAERLPEPEQSRYLSEIHDAYHNIEEDK